MHRLCIGWIGVLSRITNKVRLFPKDSDWNWCGSSWSDVLCYCSNTQFFVTWILTNNCQHRFSFCLGAVLRLWMFLQGTWCTSFPVLSWLWLHWMVVWKYWNVIIWQFTSLMIASLFNYLLWHWINSDKSGIIATVPLSSFLPWATIIAVAVTVAVNAAVIWDLFSFFCLLYREEERKSTWCFISSECQWVASVGPWKIVSDGSSSSGFS